MIALIASGTITYEAAIGRPVMWDNDLNPDLRDIVRRLTLIEQYLALTPEALAARFVLDPPATWIDGEPQCPQTPLPRP